MGKSFKGFSKALSLILAVAMVVTMVPTSAYGAELIAGESEDILISNDAVAEEASDALIDASASEDNSSTSIDTQKASAPLDDPDENTAGEEEDILPDRVADSILVLFDTTALTHGSVVDPKGQNGEGTYGNITADSIGLYKQPATNVTIPTADTAGVWIDDEVPYEFHIKPATGYSVQPQDKKLLAVTNVQYYKFNDNGTADNTGDDSIDLVTASGEFAYSVNNGVACVTLNQALLDAADGAVNKNSGSTPNYEPGASIGVIVVTLGDTNAKETNITLTGTGITDLSASTTPTKTQNYAVAGDVEINLATYVGDGYNITDKAETVSVKIGNEVVTNGDTAADAYKYPETAGNNKLVLKQAAIQAACEAGNNITVTVNTIGRPSVSVESASNSLMVFKTGGSAFDENTKATLNTDFTFTVAAPTTDTDRTVENTGDVKYKVGSGELKNADYVSAGTFKVPAADITTADPIVISLAETHEKVMVGENSTAATAATGSDQDLGHVHFKGTATAKTNGAYEFTAVAEAGYTITGITYSVLGGEANKSVDGENGVYSIPVNKINNQATIKISTESVSAAQNVGIKDSTAAAAIGAKAVIKDRVTGTPISDTAAALATAGSPYYFTVYPVNENDQITKLTYKFTDDTENREAEPVGDPVWDITAAKGSNVAYTFKTANVPTGKAVVFQGITTETYATIYAPTSTKVLMKDETGNTITDSILVPVDAPFSFSVVGKDSTISPKTVTLETHTGERSSTAVSTAVTTNYTLATSYTINTTTLAAGAAQDKSLHIVATTEEEPTTGFTVAFDLSDASKTAGYTLANDAITLGLGDTASVTATFTVGETSVTVPNTGATTVTKKTVDASDHTKEYVYLPAKSVATNVITQAITATKKTGTSPEEVTFTTKVEDPEDSSNTLKLSKVLNVNVVDQFSDYAIDWAANTPHYAVAGKTGGDAAVVTVKMKHTATGKDVAVSDSATLLPGNLIKTAVVVSNDTEQTTAVLKAGPIAPSATQNDGTINNIGAAKAVDGLKIHAVITGTDNKDGNNASKIATTYTTESFVVDVIDDITYVMVPELVFADGTKAEWNGAAVTATLAENETATLNFKLYAPKTGFDVTTVTNKATLAAAITAGNLSPIDPDTVGDIDFSTTNADNKYLTATKNSDMSYTLKGIDQTSAAVTINMKAYDEEGRETSAKNNVAITVVSKKAAYPVELQYQDAAQKTDPADATKTNYQQGLSAAYVSTYGTKSDVLYGPNKDQRGIRFTDVLTDSAFTLPTQAQITQTYDETRKLVYWSNGSKIYEPGAIVKLSGLTQTNGVAVFSAVWAKKYAVEGLYRDATDAEVTAADLTAIAAKKISSGSNDETVRGGFFTVKAAVVENSVVVNDGDTVDANGKLVGGTVASNYKPVTVSSLSGLTLTLTTKDGDALPESTKSDYASIDANGKFTAGTEFSGAKTSEVTATLKAGTKEYATLTETIKITDAAQKTYAMDFETTGASKFPESLNKGSITVVDDTLIVSTVTSGTKTGIDLDGAGADLLEITTPENSPITVTKAKGTGEANGKYKLTFKVDANTTATSANVTFTYKDKDNAVVTETKTITIANATAEIQFLDKDGNVITGDNVEGIHVGAAAGTPIVTVRAVKPNSTVIAPGGAWAATSSAAGIVANDLTLDTSSTNDKNIFKSATAVYSTAGSTDITVTYTLSGVTYTATKTVNTYYAVTFDKTNASTKWAKPDGARDKVVALGATGKIYDAAGEEVETDPVAKVYQVGVEMADGVSIDAGGNATIDVASYTATSDGLEFQGWFDSSEVTLGTTTVATTAGLVKNDSKTYASIGGDKTLYAYFDTISITGIEVNTNKPIKLSNIKAADSPKKEDTQIKVAVSPVQAGELVVVKGWKANTLRIDKAATSGAYSTIGTGVELVNAYAAGPPATRNDVLFVLPESDLIAGKVPLSFETSVSDKELGDFDVFIYGFNTVSAGVYEYIKEDGTKAVNETVTIAAEDKTTHIKDGVYYFDAEGKLIQAADWTVSDGKKYYLNAAVPGTYTIAPTEINKDGLIKVGDNYYYTDKTTGEIKTGWITDGSKKYYAETATDITSDDYGKVAIGFKEIEGKLYYFGTKAGEECNLVVGDGASFVEIEVTEDGNWKGKFEYVIGTDGVVATATEVTVSDVKYYVNSYGQKVTYAMATEEPGTDSEGKKYGKYTDPVTKVKWVIYEDGHAKMDDVLYDPMVTWTTEWPKDFNKKTSTVPVMKYKVTYKSKNNKGATGETEEFTATVTGDPYPIPTDAKKVTFTATADLSGYFTKDDMSEKAVPTTKNKGIFTQDYSFKNGGEAGKKGGDYNYDDDAEEDGTFTAVFAESGEDTLNLAYTGAKLTPEVIVSNGDKTLVKDVDYTIGYKDNQKAKAVSGKDATVTIKGKNNYSDSVILNFTIDQKDISDTDVTVAGLTVDKAGKSLSPVVSYKGTVLKEGANKDYTVSETDGTVTITGVKNFTGTTTATITKVEKKALDPISKVEVSKSVAWKYTGEEHELQASDLVVTSKGKKTLKEDEYVISYSDTVNAGKCAVTVTAVGGTEDNFSGSKTVKVTIAPAATATITVENADALTTTGTKFKATGAMPYVELSAKDGDTDLPQPVYGRDYKVAYSNNKNAGQGKAKITFQGNFKGIKAMEQAFTINKPDTSDVTVKVSDFVIGKDLKSKKYLAVPDKTLFVEYEGQQIKKGDYVVTYKQGETVLTGKGSEVITLDSDGTATIDVEILPSEKAKNLQGTTPATAQYKIVPAGSATDVTKAKVTIIEVGGTKTAKIGYTGKEIKFDDSTDENRQGKIQVKIGSGKSAKILTDTEVTDAFDVSYVNNINKGTGYVILTPKDDTYVGTAIGKFTIKAGAIKIKK